MKNIDLTNGSVLKHIKNIAIPSSIGLLFNTLFNVVDTFYAGKLSTDALAGLTISFPLFFVIIAISIGLGSGITALDAIAIGEDNNNEFNALNYNGIISGAFISIVIIIIAPIVTPLFFELTGAEGQAMKLGINYTETIFYGSAFFIFNFSLNGILNAQGDTKSFRNFLIIGFFLNLILDPLFIYGWFGLPKLSTTGIAIATVIVQSIGTIYLVGRVLKSPLFIFSDFAKAKFSFRKISDLAKQSFPATLNMLTIALGVFIINFFILKYSDDSTIAGYGVATRVEQLALLPALGLNIAVLTITGQNFGAKNYQRIDEVRRISILLGTAMMIIGAIIIYPLAPFLIRLFNDNQEVINAGTIYLRIEVIALPTYVILNVITSNLQGIKKPNFAVYIGLYRQLILPTILFYLLGNYFRLGILGVWWGIVIINWSAVFIAYLYSKWQLKKLKKKMT